MKMAEERKKKDIKEIDIRTRGLREEHEQLASSGEFVISHLYTQSVILSFFFPVFVFGLTHHFYLIYSLTNIY